MNIGDASKIAGLPVKTVRYYTAISTGQRNTCIKSLYRRCKLHCLTGRFIELPGHLATLTLCDDISTRLGSYDFWKFGNPGQTDGIYAILT
jgi:hypothetical protein